MTPDKVKDFMTKLDDLVYAQEETTLKEANDIIWTIRLTAFLWSIRTQNWYIWFRKDYDTIRRMSMN